MLQNKYKKQRQKQKQKQKHKPKQKQNRKKCKEKQRNSINLKQDLLFTTSQFLYPLLIALIACTC